MSDIDKSCSNCRNQLTGFDGGFGGLPLTCECKVYGETSGRKNCQHFKKKITKSELYEENKRLRERIKDTEECISTLSKTIKLKDDFIIENGYAEEYSRWIE